MLRHQAGQMRCRAACAAIDLGEAKSRVVGGHDDVSVADQADAAAQTKTINRCYDGYLARVNGREGGITAPVGAQQCLVANGALHLLDVDSGAESTALR